LTLEPAAALSVTAGNATSFTQGQLGASYVMAVSNAPSAGATNGAVTVSEAVPSGFTLVSLAGLGWNCPSGGNTCNRSDVLNSGEAYPNITAVFNVATSAASSVINLVTVSGGGSGSAIAADSIAILQTQIITFNALSTVNFGVSPFAVTATVDSGLTVTLSSTTTAVCAVSGGVVTIVAAGTCSITATQAGNAIYAAATSVTQSFIVNPLTPITLTTIPSGLGVSVDGGPAQFAPFTFNLPLGVHTISAPATLQLGAGTQFVFQGWSDLAPLSHFITVGSSPATYTATFQTQYQLTTVASPSAGGSVTPPNGTFYNAGSVVSLQASANNGYQFANFSGGTLTGGTNSQSVTINQPINVVANFTPIAPSLTVTVGTRTVAGSTVLVGLTLTNTGLGAATNARITSITAISDVAGAGAVTVASGTQVDLGKINPGSSAPTTVTFNWPSTATRVSFTVNFSADGGYTGSTKITTLY
jgi:hypothetical protein